MKRTISVTCAGGVRFLAPVLAAGLGRYMTPKDRGRWWVSGNRLCQKWQQWYDGKTFCFTVTKLADNRIRWVRDDGKSGFARLR